MQSEPFSIYIMAA